MLGNPAHGASLAVVPALKGRGIEEEVSLLHAAEVLSVGHSGARR